MRQEIIYALTDLILLTEKFLVESEKYTLLYCTHITPESSAQYAMIRTNVEESKLTLPSEKFFQKVVAAKLMYIFESIEADLEALIKNTYGETDSRTKHLKGKLQAYIGEPSEWAKAFTNRIINTTSALLFDAWNFEKSNTMNELIYELSKEPNFKEFEPFQLFNILLVSEKPRHSAIRALIRTHLDRITQYAFSLVNKYEVNEII